MRWAIEVALGSRPCVPGGDGLVDEVDGGAVSVIAFTGGAVAADLDRAHPITVKSLRYRR